MEFRIPSWLKPLTGAAILVALVALVAYAAPWPSPGNLVTPRAQPDGPGPHTFDVVATELDRWTLKNAVVGVGGIEVSGATIGTATTTTLFVESLILRNVTSTSYFFGEIGTDNSVAIHTLNLGSGVQTCEGYDVKTHSVSPVGSILIAPFDEATLKLAELIGATSTPETVSHVLLQDTSTSSPAFIREMLIENVTSRGPITFAKMRIGTVTFEGRLWVGDGDSDKTGAPDCVIGYSDGRVLVVTVPGYSIQADNILVR